MTEDEYDEIVKRKKENEKKFKDLYRKKVYELCEVSEYSLDEIYQWRFNIKELSELIREERAMSRKSQNKTKGFALV